MLINLAVLFFPLYVRRLFPALMVHVSGLEPRMDYNISLQVASADGFRYKFVNMKWTKVGESEINQNEDKQVYKHPNSPKEGSFWMKKPVSFKGLKITHCPDSKCGNVSIINTSYIHTKLGPCNHSILPPSPPPDIASYYAQVFPSDHY